MKFLEWEDFAKEINEYGRYGYVKKQSSYNPFTGVNHMVLEHKTRFNDIVEFVLYPDQESYDRDYKNEAYIPTPTRSEKFLQEMPKFQVEPKIDHRTREHRSERYPVKPGEKKEELEESPPRPPNPSQSQRPKPGPPRNRRKRK